MMRRLRLHAPAEDGGILCVPALEEAMGVLERNRRRLDASPTLVGGAPLSELRSLARREVANVLQAYAERFSPYPAPVGKLDCPLIVTGHQPELFHPGVWFKSFLLAELAGRAAGAAVHFLADHDLVKSTAILVPTGSSDHPLVVATPFDRMRDERPFEEFAVVDETTFASFADRVRERWGSLPAENMTPTFWKAARESASATGNLGERLAAGRRHLEQAMGFRNFEAPLSRLCMGACFHRFAVDLIANHERFAVIHNETLKNYRKAHRLRSRHHPFPALEREGDRVETPFWTWSAAQPRRRRLFVAAGPREWRLLADDQPIASIPPPDAGRLDVVGAQLAAALGEWKLRPRALTTTMFLRLCVADVFVHGVGGAKYDLVTDDVIAQFFGFAPPEFIAATATLRLPFAASDDGLDECRRLARLERELRWNPDRRLDDRLLDQDPIAGWVEEKFALMASEPASRRERRERYARFRQLNDRLRGFVETQAAEVYRQRALTEERAVARRLWRSREFAFCLHSVDRVRDVFARGLGHADG